MADPGAVVARWAHKNGIITVPLMGPGSVYLALCASGFNGQQFTFHGYCPIKEPELKAFLLKLHKEVLSSGYTQIFIETPYRNVRLVEFMIKTLPPLQNLCIVSSLHSDKQMIRNMTLKEWSESGFKPGKEPCVYLLGM
jgi:16S rRNA (cytidine1402-2'-O)-methyltransferase